MEAPGNGFLQERIISSWFLSNVVVDFLFFSPSFGTTKGSRVHKVKTVGINSLMG